MALINRGVRAQAVREAVEAIRAWDPDIQQPVGALRILTQSNHLVIQLDDLNIEPNSGQLVFGLSVDRAGQDRGNTIVSLDVKTTAAHADGTADDAISEGLQAEAAGDARAAEGHYRRALALEPSHAGALLNLGNLVFADGRYRTASELCRADTRVAPAYASAWYNLANSLDELGEQDAAVSAYRSAIDLDDGYADAHFNLALVLEKAGRRDEARPHWRAYIELQPEGESVSIAQAFLATD